MKSTTVFLLILVVTFGACKSREGGKRKKTGTESATSTAAVNAEAAAFKYEYLTLKAKAEYKEGATQQSFTMNIRMKADSVVWISVTGLGFEVARALFLKDSLFLLDRFNRNYYAYSFSDARKLLKSDLNLHQLQEILVGNAPFEWSAYKPDSMGLYLIATRENIFSSLLLNGLFRIERNDLNSTSDAGAMSVQYTNHQRVDKMWLPFQLNVRVNTENSKPELNISISEAKTDKIDDFPFAIPAKYSKGN